MKPQHFALLAGILLVAAVVLTLTARPAGEGTGGANAAVVLRLVTVTGEGEVKVKPDTVLVTFGVTQHRSSTVDAEKAVLDTMAQIQAALVSAGAEEGRTEQSTVILAPDTYQDFSGTVRTSGFQAKGTVQAVIRHVNRAQEVMNAGLLAGATSVESMAYTLSDPETAKQAAMKAALENARARAGAMARAEGERLGALHTMDVVLEESPGPATTPGGLLFRASVKATFEY